MTKSRSRARELAKQYLAGGDATGWFDALYVEAEGDAARIPWADLAPNPGLAEWVEKNEIAGEGKTALVVGCGLGDDAEMLAERGFRVTAFDISATAIAWCRRLRPDSSVQYVAADLLAAPDEWKKAFDFVIEVYTLQALPDELRPAAIRAIASLVAEEGALLVVARGRDPEEDPGEMPWPLTRDELQAFAAAGLTESSFEDFFDNESPPVRRFRVLYSR